MYFCFSNICKWFYLSNMIFLNKQHIFTFVVVNAAIAVFAAVIAHNLQGLVQVWFDINKTELEIYFKNWAQEWLHD